VPVLAIHSQSGNSVVVTFDRALTPGFSAAGNWTAVGNPPVGFRDVTFAVPLVVAGNTVTAAINVGLIPVPGPARISYAAAPPDILGIAGAPAAAFVDFPMATVP